MKKILYVTILASAIILFCSCGATFNSEVNMVTLEYSVTSKHNGNEKKLGSYLLEYDLYSNILTETKGYRVEIMSDETEVKNIKYYQYDEYIRLNFFAESEDGSGNDRYARHFMMNYSNDDWAEVKKSEVLEKSDSKDEIIPIWEEYYLPYDNNICIGISDILSFRLHDKAVDLKDIWFTYDVSGFIDTYKTLGVETIENDFLGEVECRKVLHEAMFSTTFWLDEQNNVVRIEQVMGGDYLVIFELQTMKEEVEVRRISIPGFSGSGSASGSTDE